MRIPRPLARTAVALGGIGLFVILTVLLVPADEFLRLANRLLEPEGYSLQAGRFGRAFPLGFSASRLELRSEKGPLLKAETLTVRLQFLPLFTGKLALALEARVGGGTVSGEAVFGRTTRQFRLAADNVLLEDIPFFSSVTGAQVKGLLGLKGGGELKGSSATGSLQLAVKGADLQGVKLGETPLPDASYQTVQGMLRFAGNRATLESFNLQGDSIFVRLKGDMPLSAPLAAAPLNLTLELMPKPEFLEKQKFVFLLLGKYLDTPGHYQIPVRGVLGKPLIQ
jgi:type II secretion system protein N